MPTLRSTAALLLAALVGPACSTSEDAREAPPDGGEITTGPPDASAGFDGLIRAIQADGNQVQVGKATPFLLEDCGALPSCFASNATSPYILWNLPPAPGQDLPSSTMPLPPRTPAGMRPAWRLRPDEVIVYAGRTPPRAAYFSFAPYLFERLDPAGTAVPIFASLSDAFNQVNLATGPGGPFDASTVLILTAHAEMEAKTRRWLEAAGYDPAAINTMALPSDVLRLGQGPDADGLMMLQRVALFEDPEAGRRYLDDLPVELLRITPDDVHAPDPLPTPARTPRGSGSTETHLAPALDALEAAIRNRHGAPSTEPFTMASASIVASVFDPAACIRDVKECKGEVSDTTYSAGPIEVTTLGGHLRLTDDARDYFITFGVNHEATGKATYSNVVVNNWNKQAGVAALDSRAMSGSARAYLPDHPDAEQLFVVKVARSCNGEAHCLEIATGFPGIDLDQDIVFLFRAYLEPGRSVSPGPSEILTERVLHYVP